MTGDLGAVLSVCRAQLSLLSGETPRLANCEPFSPDAYNAIAARILGSLYDCVERIDRDFVSQGYHDNLALLLYCELHQAACGHYFAEYERSSGISQSAVNPTPRARGLGLSRIARAGRNRVRRVLGALKVRSGKADARVAFIGSAAFPWSSLVDELAVRGVDLERARGKRGGLPPRVRSQRRLLVEWADDLHEVLAAEIADPPGPRPLGASAVDHCVDRLLEACWPDATNYDMIVTGTLGKLDTRVLALQAQGRGVPVLTIHHGGHHFLFDEPYNALYEVALPDARLVYGSVPHQERIGTVPFSTNIWGNPIALYSRTDAEVARHVTSSDVEPLGSLSGKKVLYVANTMMGLRYGPYRDVHPTVYREWQDAMLGWLEEQSGRRPLVRLHPKRPGSEFDPGGYERSGGTLAAALDGADVYAIDYPTTTLAPMAATSKPVLFFDIGLRRLHPRALEVVRQRCHYGRVDILHPQRGLSIMERDLSRECTNSFSPTFCLGPEPVSEARSAADAICAYLGLE